MLSIISCVCTFKDGPSDAVDPSWPNMLWADAVDEAERKISIDQIVSSQFGLYRSKNPPPPPQAAASDLALYNIRFSFLQACTFSYLAAKCV